MFRLEKALCLLVLAVIFVPSSALASEKFDSKVETIFGPQKDLLERIYDLIEKTDKSIYVEQYLLPHELNGQKSKILELLERKARDGKEVLVLLDRNEANFKTAEFLVGRRSEVKVKFYGRDFGNLHSKMTIIDNETAIISSINFNVGSLFRNREVGAIVEGKAAKEFANAFRSEWGLGKEAVDVITPSKSQKGNEETLFSYVYYIVPPIAGLALFLAARNLL